jgi:hypothetical protein
MKHPQVIVRDADGWLAKQLRELAGESRWLVRTTRSVDTALSLARGAGVGVLLVQFEPADEKPAALALVADASRLAPDVPVVAVSDSKLPDAERAAWAAALFDLGARYVLFPPLTKPVLEDVVSGLMAATIRRVLGEGAVLPPLPRRAASDEVIDLADEGVP